MNRQAVLSAESNGFRTVVYNLRGIGDVPLDVYRDFDFYCLES